MSILIKLVTSTKILIKVIKIKKKKKQNYCTTMNTQNHKLKIQAW